MKIFLSNEYEIEKIEPDIKGLKETWASGTVLKGNASGKYFDRYLSPRVDSDGLGVLYKVDGIGEDGLGYRYFTGPKREGATKGKFYSGVPTVRINDILDGESKKYKPIINFNDYSSSFGNIRHEGGVDFRAGKKPVDLLKQYISISTGPDNEDIVLDFFSGSSSTAHAVMQLNAEDDGNRKFIMVQIQEKTPEDSDYQRAGFKNICEIGKERIRRAGDKIHEEIINKSSQMKSGEKKYLVDIGFRVFKVDSTNMKDVYYAANDYDQQMLTRLESNIKEDRTDLDLLYGVILNWGLPLSLPHIIEEIDGVSVHTVDEGSLIACFADKISETVVREIAKRQPLRVVFRDSSFSNSPEKINVEEIFKLLAPNTSVKVI